MELIDKMIDKTKSVMQTIRKRIRAELTQRAKDYLSKTKPENNEVNAKKIAKKKSPTKKSTAKEPAKVRLPEAKQEDILTVVRRYEKGIKQTELYKELSNYNRKKISILLAKMDEEKTIKREKVGTSYIVFSA